MCLQVRAKAICTRPDYVDSRYLPDLPVPLLV